MNPSNAERAPSRPFCRWNVEAIVVVRGGCEESAWDVAVRKNPNAIQYSTHDVVIRSASCRVQGHERQLHPSLPNSSEPLVLASSRSLRTLEPLSSGSAIPTKKHRTIQAPHVAFTSPSAYAFVVVTKPTAVRELPGCYPKWLLFASLIFCSPHGLA